MNEDNAIIVRKYDYIYVHRDGLYVIKEEIRELEKLLEEAKERLNNEYRKNGGRTWYEYIKTMIFGYW